MPVLIIIGFLGGLATGISPCSIPVVPVLFAAGTAPGGQADRHHPGRSLAVVGGLSIQQDQMAPHGAPTSIPQDEYAYDGNWAIGSESSTAGSGASIELRYQAKVVYLVLGGTGTVSVSVNGTITKSVAISGEPKLYQLIGASSSQGALLLLSVTPGVAAYYLTFG